MKTTPIAFIKSPYKQKFAIPRQPGLVKAAVGEIVFEEAFADPNCLRALEEFSHLWLLFHFHETADKGWSPMVQPPRLGGKEKVGVFASRSTFRPNSIGMSVVENLGWEQQGRGLILRVGSIDLLNNTPIIDIKPYLPYCESIPNATSGFAPHAPTQIFKVQWSLKAQEQKAALKMDDHFEKLLQGVLGLDPRPAYKKTEKESLGGLCLSRMNVKYQIQQETITILSIENA
ncbi:MAG: tRNA (N6-threonylcarbamoyladenosine(37)-N6)-methyltransferase TrmO [Gammaproteobacteria bacterium]|nr:tRNA (N6-threonylcarbamoyladenosine(37)-N6)-methyltransferase TrmO [Gammaproteobacteria bacterium]